MAQVLNRLRYRNTPIPVNWVNLRNHLQSAYCFCQVLYRKLQENENNKILPEEEEVECYFSATHIIDDKVDPVIFWVQQDKNYSLLSTVAKDVLIIPGSSAPMEHDFSTVHVGNETVR